ncbi:MAG TPA: hypothetical protein VMT93_11105, partial [Gemmatimonadaceae bacterium]|nr:hypothetical protein [Gemmatimonadaceae bacterium]
DAALPGTWDISWLDQLKGKHKQVFDTSHIGFALIVPTNYLDAMNTLFGMNYPDVNAVIGIGGSAFPLNAGDALWAKYEIGRRWDVKDPATGQWATHNIFLDGQKFGKKVTGVKPLMARGAIFWQCNNALNGIVSEIAADLKLDFDQLKAEFVANLVPGVKLVIAHTAMIGLAQEHGCTYESI